MESSYFRASAIKIFSRMEKMIKIHFMVEWYKAVNVF